MCVVKVDRRPPRGSLRHAGLLGCALALALLLPASGVRGQAPGADAAPGLREALELYRTEQYAEALPALLRYLEAHPNAANVRKLVGLAYLKLEQPALALPHLRAAAESLPDDESLPAAVRDAEQMWRLHREREARRPKPDDIRDWYARAERLIQKKRFADAEALLNRVLQEQPDHAPALLRLAEIFSAQSRFPESASLYRRLLHNPEVSAEEIELRLARVLAWAERYPEAVRHFDTYLRRRPHDVEARFQFAEVLRWSGQPGKAVPHYESALESRPNHLEARVGLGLALHTLEEYAGAVAELDRALQLGPDHAEARAARERALQAWHEQRKRQAALAQEKGNYAEAIQLLQNYLRDNPADAETLLRLARVQSWTRDYRNAAASYERYLGSQPADRQARLELAEVLSWSGNFDAARAAFRQVVDADPENARALVGLIRASQWSGKLEEAEPFLERLERAAPADPAIGEVRAQLAQLRQHRMRERAEQLEQRKDYPAALRAYREYLAAYGSDRRTEFRIAQLLAWNRQYGEAAEEYRQYIARYPDDLEARLDLADVLRWNAQYDDALQNYSALLAGHPRHPRALLGRAEALYASSDDLFAVRGAYSRVLAATPREPLAVRRYREIRDRLRPRLEVHSIGLFDSDDYARAMIEPQLSFLLPEGYRLVTRFQGLRVEQDRPLPAATPALVQLDQRRVGLDSILWGAQAGLRLERTRSWGAWGLEALGGGFSDERATFTLAADLTLHLSEQGRLWTRFEHGEAAFDLNTLASLLAGIRQDSWRTYYRQPLPAGFEFSAGYNLARLSAGRQDAFNDNLRHAGHVGLSFRRLRVFQPGYSYSASSYRVPSPLYFSPELYHVHRLEGLLVLFDRPAGRASVNGSGGFARINGASSFEFSVAPQAVFHLPGQWELAMGYQFGRSRSSAFGNPTYRVHSFSLTARLPLPRREGPQP